MGACYSKQPRLGNSSKTKAPKAKHYPPIDSLKECAAGEDQVDESSKLVADQPNNTHLERRTSEDVIIVTSSLFLEEGTKVAEGKVKNGGCGVAPSDSGIESIGTIPDDSQEVSTAQRGKSDISKRLQRLSRGSCNKCGNFRLDDTAITALLSDTYCLCGPRQAGRSNVNPDCQTHGARSAKAGQDVSGVSVSNGADDISVEKKSVNNSVNLHMDRNISNKSNVSKISVNRDSEVLAPLAHFDSVDLNLSDYSPTSKSSKRRSLLSEILDLTDSICKCDFYSNEFCCVVDTHAKSECNNSGAKRGSDMYRLSPERVLTDVSFESQASDVTITKSDNEEQPSDFGTSKSNLCSPKRMAGLSKNVSFAHENTSGNLETACVIQSSYLTPTKLNYRQFRDGDSHITSETSSGIFTHNGSVSETRLAPGKDSHKRTLSLGSQGAVLSCSSSEALDDFTEDDLASLDLDSLSRVTSLSYGSIRQLVESTEDLVQPLEDTRKVVIDGEEFVAVPAETYLQLQSDLASLRQQLLSLSSLMQEVCDRRDVDQQAFSASFGI